LPKLIKWLGTGLLALCLQAATYQGVPTREQLNTALQLVRERSSSDAEMSYFEVDAFLEKGKLILRGKVGDVEQKLLLLAGFHQFHLPLVDQVELFPFRQISTPYAWVRTPWLDGFAEPNPASPLKTQLLFGTLLRILKTQGDWALVQSVSDRYISWVAYPEVLPVPEQKYDELVGLDSVMIRQPETQLYQDEALTQPLLSVLAGTRLPLIRAGENVYEVLAPGAEGIRPAYLAKSALRLFIPSQPFLPEELVAEARYWLKTPYLEGGTTIKGCDDGALIQHIFKQFGVLLPRKPRQFLPLTLSIRDSEQLKPGDLYLYGQHIGLYLGEGFVLHPVPDQHRFLISSIHPGAPRYYKPLHLEFKQGARLLLGNPN